MKYTPILFSTPMVQAILEGRKTQTRRVLKKKSTALKLLNSEFTPQYICSEGNESIRPYNVGDILWVRETFQVCRYAKAGSNVLEEIVVYKADGGGFGDYEVDKWKPSIHMPKSACRLFLQVKSVRVERLQDISEIDAINEGAPISDKYMTMEERCNNYNNPSSGKKGYSHKAGFEELWNRINGEQSWNDNFWVWVVDFLKIEKPENFN